MKTELTEASPAKALLEELELFRAVCHGCLASIGTRFDGQINEIRTKVEALGAGENVPSSKNRDIRDMLTLLRNSGIKPEKGRRKDLKKLDSISEDLSMMVSSWK